MQGLHGLGSLLQPRRGEDAICHCLLVTSALPCLRNGQRREFDDFVRMIGMSQWARTKPLVSGSWFFVWNYENAWAILLVCMWFRRLNPTYVRGSRFSHRGATATRPGSHRIHRRIWFLYCRWFMLICSFWDKCLIHFEYRSPVEIFILHFLKKNMHFLSKIKKQYPLEWQTDQGTTREPFQFLPCHLRGICCLEVTFAQVAVRAFPSRDAIALCYRRRGSKWGFGKNSGAHWELHIFHTHFVNDISKWLWMCHDVWWCAMCRTWAAVALSKSLPYANMRNDDCHCIKSDEVSAKLLKSHQWFGIFESCSPWLQCQKKHAKTMPKSMQKLVVLVVESLSL